LEGEHVEYRFAFADGDVSRLDGAPAELRPEGAFLLFKVLAQGTTFALGFEGETHSLEVGEEVRRINSGASSERHCPPQNMIELSRVTRTRVREHGLLRLQP
jgi:hypothetical protein